MRASFELTSEHPSKAHHYVSRSYHFFSLGRSFFVAQQKAVTHFCHKIGIGKYCNNHHHHHYSSANLFYAVFCKKRTKPSSIVKFLMWPEPIRIPLKTPSLFYTLFSSHWHCLVEITIRRSFLVHNKKPSPVPYPIFVNFDTTPHLFSL